jgi:hypothetical protein
MVCTNATANYSMALRTCFGGICYLQLQGRRSIRGKRLVRQYVPLKCTYINAQLHGITAHNIVNLMSLF